MKNVLRAVITILLLAGLSHTYAQYPACPQVVTSPVGVIPCGQTCTNLYAQAEGGYSTTAYTYANVAFAPPVAFNVGTPLTLHIDDGWSGVINLPFTFCFFGNSYTKAIFSSNGSVGFNTGNAGAGSNWDIYGAVPASVVTNGETDMYNTINGPWQDLDNTNQGTIYSYLGGTAPCRFFAASWYNCAMYGDAESVSTDYCTHTDHQYQQIVIYETSNVIDINIQEKDVPCDNSGNGYWNGGLAVEGLINANASTFVGPANRNATIWNATNDALRFTPNGTPTYTITWFQGTTQIGTGSPIQVCPAGPTTYTAKATYNTCAGGTITVSDSVFVDIARLTVSDSAHQPTCGSNNGSVYANFNANSGIISYGWAPGGAGDSTLHNLAPGTYVFTVTDSAGCTTKDTEVLSPNGGLTVTVANDTVNTCTGGPVGTLIATVTGSTGPFTYAWSNMDITDTITGLAAGTYMVTVTAPGGCSATASGTVVFVGGTPVNIVTLKLINDACYGGNTGQIKVTGANGPPPYTYNWSNIGAGPDSIIGLTAGTYSVTVTDRFGCTADSTYTITQGPQIVFNPPVITNVTCAGDSNGSITDSATGGTGPLDYVWNVNNDSTPTVSNLPAGTYTLTVTDSLGCSATASYAVTAPPPIVDTAVLDSATCSAPGAIIVTASGGTPPYTFNWSNLATGDSIGGLAAGTSYTVTITDSSGCSITASFTVPAGSSALIFGPPVIVEPTCNGFSNGSITATASGGTGTIKYSWSNVDSLALDSNLATGTYSVTISDSLGCSASTTYFLNQPIAVAIAQAIVDSVACSGGSNGSITITPGGGTAPYSYVWSGVPGGPDLTDSATGLAAGGPYVITVTDSLGCSVSASYTIGQPTAIAIDSAEITPEGCTTGGSIVVTATGGSGALNYAWSVAGTGDSIGGLASGTYTLTVTDQHGCSITASYFVPSIAGAITIDSVHITNVTCNSDSNGMIIVFASDSGGGGSIAYLWSNLSTSDTASDLINGTYCVTVTDSLGCSASACYHISEPNPIIILSPLLTEPLCYGDSNGCIEASAIGGTGPITFTWSNNGFVGDTDCGLAAGTYGVTATDSLGCSASTTFNLGQPTPDSVTAIVANITCNGAINGSITATGSGGSGGFTYSWTGGLTGQTISGLDTGTYCVTATDANGCSASACFTVTEPPALVIDTLVSTPVTCATLGTDSVSASGGTGTLTYLWSNGGTTALITGLTAQSYCVTVTDSLSCTVSACDTVLNSASVVVIDSVHIDSVTCITGGSIIVYTSGGNTGLTYTWSGTSQTGDSIGNLSAGTYCVTAADSTGCSASACYTLNPPTPLTISAVVDSDRCNGDNTGSIILIVTGTGPFIYVWAPNVSSNDSALGLTAGPYCVAVTDLLGCFQTACYTVNQPAAITQNGVVTNVTCNNLGSIAVSASGGTGTLSITWSPSSVTGFNPTGLSAGQYIDTVRDQNGCSSIDTFTVAGSGGNPPVVSGAVIDSVSCFGGSNGSITVTVTGGTPPLTYAWNNLEHSASDTDLHAGIFGVQVTDSVGCTVDGGPYSVGQPPAINVTGIVTNATCTTGGSILVTASGGTGTLTPVWTPNTASGFNPTGLLAGTYVLTVTDQHGCTKMDTFIVSGSGGAITLTNSVTNISCHGDTNGSITITASGDSNYVYTWSPNVGTDSTVTGLGAGTYSVTVTGTGGCSASASVSLSQPKAIAITLTAPSVLCAGAHTVASVVVDSGGTGPYTYHWFNNGSTTSVDSVLQAGNVAVTVTDSLGCTVSASRLVNQDFFDFSEIILQPNCSAPVPSIQVAITQASIGPYTYSLDSVSVTTNDSSYTFDSIYPGTYSLTVKDGYGCSLSQTPIVNTPPAIDSVSAHEIPSPCSSVSNGQVIVDIAPGDSSHAPFTYSLNGGGFQSDSVFSGLAPGSYTVVVHNNLGCNDTVTAPVVVTSDSALMVSFTYDTIGPNPAPGAINSDTITLMPNVTGFTNPVYSWSPSTGLSCTSCPNPVVYSTPSATVNGPIKYYVTVSDSLDPQCAAEDSIVIIPKGLFQMPDAFTPNGDGKNDLFGPVKYSYLTVTAFRIYNRWGQMVHNSTDYWDGKFDGKDQPEGAYVYYIEVTYTNGFEYGNLVTGKQEGSVILLR